MAGCKRCALKGEKGKGKKEKGGKNGDQNRFFYIYMKKSDLLEATMHPHPYFGNFFKYLWPS